MQNLPGFILRFPDRHRSDSPEVRKPGIIRIASPARQLHTGIPASPASAFLKNRADRAIFVFLLGKKRTITPRTYRGSAIHCIAYGGDTTPTHPANRDCKSAAATARPDTANADAAVRPPPRKTMFPSLAKKPDGPAAGFPALPTQNRSCTRKPASRQNDMESDLPNVRTIRNVRKRTEQKNRLPERKNRSGSSNNFTKQNQTLRCPS